MLTTMIIVFLVGYLLIALEHPLKINKAGTALLTGTILWVLYTLGSPQFIPTASAEEFKLFLDAFPFMKDLPYADQCIRFVIDHQILDSIGEIAETLIFLIGAMITVELVDSHGGFMFITNRITTNSKRKLLFVIATITFFMSAVLDNLTTSIVMVMLIRKLIGNYKERWIFGSIIVIAANSGGAWSPIGDVTTIMLWVRGNISTSATIPHLFLPSLVSALVPVLIISRYLHGKVTPPNAFEENRDNLLLKVLKANEKLAILCIGVFCLLFGINFNLYFFLLIRRFRDAFCNEELRWYLGIVAFAIVTIVISLMRNGVYDNALTAFRYAGFQVSSIITTTGYSTTDFNVWPEFSRAILVLLMFVGACAGSTGGGIKVSRVMIMLKMVKNELSHLIHPKRVRQVTFEGRVVNKEILRSISVFFIAYAVIFGASALLISLDNLDFTTNFTAVAATLNNIGPGVDKVGPAANFSVYSHPAKFVLMFDMLAGRLELFPLLLLFSPSTWKRS